MSYQGNSPPPTPLTTNQIAPGAVQPANLSAGGPSWDNSNNLLVPSVKNASSSSVNIALNTDGSATFAQMPVGPFYFAMRNKIINGAMQISQRGTSFSVSGNYTLDRWFVAQNTSMNFTITQSTNAPSGFTNSLLFTRGTGAAPAAGDTNYLQQVIEGFNVSDFAWGTASAKTITLSFWAYTGAAGTYSGSIRNAGAPYISYPFSYAISSANTWTYISIVIPGPTTGVWATDNSAGPYLFFDYGSGTTFRGTAGTWAAANYVGATGASTYPISTTGGTLAITGVQLEVGSVATPFERRNYQTEFSMCLRYYEITASLVFQTAGSPYVQGYWSVQKRTTPTLTVLAYDAGSGATFGNSAMEPTKSFFQNGNHSQTVAQARLAGSAEF